MTHRPIIDAGPGLNFLSINRQTLLIAVLGRLSTPETVQDEVLRKARKDERFRPAELVWKKLKPTYLEILSDEVTPELAAAVHRITRMPMGERMRRPEDLGETMVIAHAAVAAEAGKSVTVLIDDGNGVRTAALERNRLNRLRVQGRPVGSIRIVGTLTVLETAAGKRLIQDRAEMRDLYRRLRLLDDGLPPIEATDLLSARLWS